MSKPKRDIIPAERMRDYRVTIRKTPVFRDNSNAYTVKTEWDLTYKGELVDTFPTKKIALDYIVEKETT